MLIHAQLIPNFRFMTLVSPITPFIIRYIKFLFLGKRLVLVITDHGMEMKFLLKL